MNQDKFPTNSHSIIIGYLLWLFGFLGAHRFYKENEQPDTTTTQ